MFKKIIILPIKGYKKFISPLLGNNCRFTPSCSSYAITAIDTHGVIKGGILSVWRISRCNSFCKFGHDPVPKKKRWKNENAVLTKEKW